MGAACGAADRAAPAPLREDPPAERPAHDAGDAPATPAGLEWPNAEHRANSDPWIVTHHDDLTKMRPRVLAINLDNDPATRSKFESKIAEVIAGLNEGSRPHGYADAKAAPFLAYEVFKHVDMADDTPPPGWTHKYASRAPARCTRDPSAWYSADYSALFSPAYTAAYDVADPDAPSEKLGLCALIDRGMVHEVWLYMNGDSDPMTCPDGSKVDVGYAEILESKPIYAGGEATGAFEHCAGNGCLGRIDAKAFAACGRTVRVLYVNSTRGPGCAIHSAGHGYEWMVHSEAVGADLRAWFDPFGNFDLKERLGLPFGDWYACASEDCVTFTGKNSLTWKLGDRSGAIAAYDQGCGNVHFAPNARAHYDENDVVVDATCETYGIGGAPRPFSRASYARYEAMAPDCGGAWQIYWRQSFIGHASAAKDARGRPMKNWWPYLFY
ncbi:MAG: hypothetical protein KF819_05750 [Labilithrix sp.]|nr:hypothetical protein [Labilithrix sp.]